VTRPYRILLGLILLLLSGLAFATGCKQSPEGSQNKTGTRPKAERLETMEVRDETENLLLTWVDDRGDFHVVQAISEVPEASRERVRVVITDRALGTGDLVYVADLRSKKPDGSYSVSSMTRAAWDEVGAARRKARLEALAPSAVPSAPPPGVPDGGAPNGVKAIIYGADWCKPCHDAERYLKARGVTVVMKDVDESDVARKEMQALLEKHRQGGAQIPVIDIMGELLIGFSPHGLERAVTRARATQAL
jgi:glutaredoxin